MTKIEIYRYTPPSSKIVAQLRIDFADHDTRDMIDRDTHHTTEDLAMLMEDKYS